VTSGPADDLDVEPLQVAVLDEGTVDQLFFDVGAAAELIDVAVRGGEDVRGAVSRPGLGEARDALVSGRAVGIQLRYRFRGVEWWDTLVRIEGGVRLVRRAI
jgi:hypothetical protein